MSDICMAMFAFFPFFSHDRMSDRIFVCIFTTTSPINPISSASLLDRPAGLAVVAMVAKYLAQVGARAAQAGAKVIFGEDIFGEGRR